MAKFFTHARSAGNLEIIFTESAKNVNGGMWNNNQTFTNLASKVPIQERCMNSTFHLIIICIYHWNSSVRIWNTPNWELTKRMKEVEAQNHQIRKNRFKIIEKGGVTLENLLTRSNPWSEENCGRHDCFPCRGGRGVNAGDERERCLCSGVLRMWWS